MFTPKDASAQLRIACGIANGVAVLATIFRLFVRFRKSRLWVDDGLALFSMFTLIVQLVSITYEPKTQHAGVIRYYVLSNMFYAAIWSARLSILYSIIRITQTFRTSRLLLATATLFLLTWIILTAQIYWECETKPTWKYLDDPQCNLSIAVAICQLISDTISDSILLFVPIRLFMIISDKTLRYRVMLIFGTCIGTTIVSTVHAAFLFLAMPHARLIAAVVENSVSLVVCNMPVVITAVLKLQKEDPVSEISPSGLIPYFGKTSESNPTTAGTVNTVQTFKTEPQHSTVKLAYV